MSAVVIKAPSMASGLTQREPSVFRRDRMGHVTGDGKKSSGFQLKPPSTSLIVEPGDEPRIVLSESSLGKNRLVWTPDLHARFLAAIKQLGLEQAVPRTILKAMNVEGMSRENVASHLQKYRIWHRRKEQSQPESAAAHHGDARASGGAPTPSKASRPSSVSSTSVSRSSTSKGQHRMHPYAPPATLPSSAAAKLHSAGAGGSSRSLPAPAMLKPGQPAWPGKHMAARNKYRDPAGMANEAATLRAMKENSALQGPPAIAIPALSADALAALAAGRSLPSPASTNVTAIDALFARTASALSVCNSTCQAATVPGLGSKLPGVSTSVSLVHGRPSDPNLPSSLPGPLGATPLGGIPGARPSCAQHVESWRASTHRDGGANHDPFLAGDSDYLVIDWPTLDDGALVLQQGQGGTTGVDTDSPHLAAVSGCDAEHEASVDSGRSTASKLGRSTWAGSGWGWEDSLASPDGSLGSNSRGSVNTWQVGSKSPWATACAEEVDAEFVSGLLAASSASLSLPEGTDSGRGMAMEDDDECTSVLLEVKIGAPTCLDDVMPSIALSEDAKGQQHQWVAACDGGDVGVFVGDLVEPTREGVTWSGAAACVGVMAEANMPPVLDEFAGYLEL